MEAETPFRAVCVDRKSPPVHTIGSLADRLEPYPHHIAAHLGRSRVDAFTRAVTYGDGTERRLQLFRKRDRYFPRRRYGAARNRFDALELGMRESRAGGGGNLPRMEGRVRTGADPEEA